jgi:hypothetical protein
VVEAAVANVNFLPAKQWRTKQVGPGNEGPKTAYSEAQYRGAFLTHLVTWKSVIYFAPSAGLTWLVHRIQASKMGHSPTCLRNVIINLGILLLLSGSNTRAAQAACGEEARVQCHSEFETVDAVAWSADSFTIAGQLKGGTSPGIGLLRLSGYGMAKSAVFPIPLPASFPPNRSAAESRKLIALPNGDIIVLGVITVTEGLAIKQVAWATRVAPNDRILWSRTYPDPSASIIVHSAVYDQNGDKIILVGRRTNGLDPSSRCENWSQSWVMSVAAASGQPLLSSLIIGEQTKSFNNRQAIYDIAQGENAGSYVVTGFRSAKHSESEGLCQDNIFVGILVQSGARWMLSQTQTIGANNANEVAFTVKPAGDGRYLLAGYGRDPVTRAPAAQAYRINVTPFAIEGFLSTPFPADGSDKTGGDRYRLIVPLAQKGWFLLAGSVSASKDAFNQAMWQIVSANLKNNAPPQLLSSGSSDLFDAVLAPDGKVFAVGRWRDEGRNVGWSGFIGAPVLSPTAAGRRPPDPRLPRLSNLPAPNGIIQLPTTAISTGAGYFERDLEQNSQLDLAISFPASSSIAASAYFESGDADLLVMDANMRPVAFSNFRKSATELLLASVSPGQYVLSIIVHARVPALELRIGPDPRGMIKVIPKLERLSDQQRIQFAQTLISAGYNSPSNPDIALGGESARAFLAIQEGAQRDIQPMEIAQFVGQ